MVATEILNVYINFEYNEETGNYYGRARLYTPASGRFLSEDPIGFAGLDANLYRYVNNNPVNFVDPDGLILRALGLAAKPNSGKALGSLAGGVLGGIVGGVPGAVLFGFIGGVIGESFFPDRTGQGSEIFPPLSCGDDLKTIEFDNAPVRPFTPSDYINPNPPDPSQPQLKPNNRRYTPIDINDRR